MSRTAWRAAFMSSWAFFVASGSLAQAGGRLSPEAATVTAPVIADLVLGLAGLAVGLGLGVTALIGSPRPYLKRLMELLDGTTAQVAGRAGADIDPGTAVPGPCSPAFGGLAQAAIRPALERGHCPVCAQKLEGPVVVCERCQVPAHADCWDYQGGCAVFACGSRRRCRVKCQAPMQLSGRTGQGQHRRGTRAPTSELAP